MLYKVNIWSKYIKSYDVILCYVIIIYIGCLDSDKKMNVLSIKKGVFYWKNGNFPHKNEFCKNRFV